MARSIGASLPDHVFALLRGDNLRAHIGLTLLLLSETEDGWPHLALLSIGEVLALSPDRLRLALWPQSTATANLTRRGRATLALVHEAASYSVRLSAERGEDLSVSNDYELATFDAQVTEVFEDVAPYATLTSGITYQLHDPEAVLARWEKTLRALRVPKTG